MAYCTNCGHEISDVAASCPQCGQPTGVATMGTFQYAGWWMRFAGALIDGIVTGIAGLILVRGRYYGVVIDFLYHWLLIAYWGGQTLGKKALGIKITRPDGSPVDLGTAAARSAMRIVSGLALALGFLWAAWDPEKRTWHDMVADTRAYRAP